MSSATCDSDVAANSLYGNLVDETQFSLPVVDLTSSEFTNPSTLNNPLFEAQTKLTEADLTSRSPRGTGMFDAMMESTKAHLQEEFAANRITGKEYTEAYVSLTTAAMSTATQYLLQKDNSYWSAIMAQKQAQAAEMEVVKARVELERSKAELRAQQYDTKTRAAQYAHTKLMIASEDAKRCLTQAQSAQVTYETDFLLPKQLEAVTMGITKTTAEKDQILYQNSAILPAQLLGIQKDTGVKTYQLENVLPAQVAGVTEDTVGKTYTNQFILPEQLENLREQVEANRAKTLDTRTDGITPVTGTMGKQKDLHAQQITSYQRDAESKVVKMLIDTWITGKSMDENYGTPTEITMGSIDSAVSSLRANLSL